MKILAFAASNSRNSINKKLASHAAELLKAESSNDAEVQLLDLNDFEVPLFSVDTESDSGVPDAAKRLFDTIGSCDAIVISYAEHNGGYTAAWKSIFDWMSRIDRNVFHDKPMLALSTSPGPGGAQNVMKTAVDSASYFGANIKASLSVPSFGDNFDSEAGKLSDVSLAEQLNSAVKKVSESV